jgi:prephenate dehydrogenase
MKTAIIGAGKMGRWFTKFFLDEGDAVIVSSRSKEKLLKIRDEFGVEVTDNVNAVKNADRVLICVPMENFEDVVQEIHSYLKPCQIIIDICSLKESPVKIMHKYIKTGTILGTHPVFGPGVKSIKNQNFILTPINKKEKKIAENFKSWLEKRQANVFIMPPKKHDELMSVVLGLPHFLGLVVCDTLLDYGNFLEARKVAGSSFKMLLMLAEAVASEETGFYTSLQFNLPKIRKIENLFLKKSKEWLNLIKRQDKMAFSNNMELVKLRLMKINSDYAMSYEIMHKFLENC